MSMTIRRAAPGDEAALTRLNGMVQSLHVGARPDVFVPISPADVAAWFGTILASGTHAGWLAEVDASPVGCVVAVIHEHPATPFSRPRRWCEIDQLGVADDMRRRGVARALVDAAVAWARKEGTAHITAQCWSFNLAAQDAFSRLGFEPMTVRLERDLRDSNRPTSG
jgi:GNAT superfamily N-acetyltransferase